MSSNGTQSGSATNGNGTSKDLERNEKHETKLSEWRFSNVIEDFKFVWFTTSMSVGILSILLHQLPYRFNGIGVLSTILFVMNLVLFVVLFIMLLLRVVMFPKIIAHSFTTDLTELNMLGTVVIAWFTLTAQIGLTVSTAGWGGFSWFLVAYVMWWIGTFFMFATAVFVFFTVANTSVADLASLNPSMVIPFVGTSTNALVGAIIINYSAEVNARLAVPVIIVAYIIGGVGLWVALMAYSMYWTRLLNHGLPPAEQSPSLLLLIGPPGQLSASFILLGSASSTYFGEYNKGTFLTATSGATMATIGVFFGLLMLGLALLLLCFVLVVLIKYALQKKHSYSLLWWGTLFPLATVDTSFVALATALDSPTFRALAEALFVILFINLLVNTGFTLMKIFQGQLLSGRREIEVEKEQ